MKRVGHIFIHGKELKPAALARGQNKTAAKVWPHLREHHSFLLADPVGAGKSYIALSLALGLWRSARRCRTPFRLLVIASTTELSDSWLQKLAGQVDPQQPGIGKLAQRPGPGSFFHSYLNPTLQAPLSDVVVYQLRRRYDVERLNEEILAAANDRDISKWNLRPRTATDTARIEVLICSPRWALKHLMSATRSADRVWLSWLSRADALIADEIFSAKNPNSLYGQLIRPWHTGYRATRPHPWRCRRPSLLGLSATLLSRDLSDAKEIFEIAIKWRLRSIGQERLLVTIRDHLHSFSRALRNGLRESGIGVAPWAKQYDAARKTLEKALANIITRSLIRKSRQHLFWAVGRRKVDSTPASRADLFPINGPIAPILTSLQDQFAGSPGASESLTWFIGEWTRRPASNEPDATTTWTSFSESAAGTTPNPKLTSLQEWLKNAYLDRERDWLSPSMAMSPRFKILVYVHHLHTAAQLNPRARDKTNLGNQIQDMLGRLMLRTSRKVARRNLDLFEGGRLESPRDLLRSVLTSHGWTIERLVDLDRTLLLAACINANKGSKTSEKILRIAHTLRGSLGDRRLTLFRSVIRRHLLLRHKVLTELGRQDLLSFEEKYRRSGRKLALAPSSALLDPEFVDLKDTDQQTLLDAFSALVRGQIREVMFATNRKSAVLVQELAALLVKSIRANPIWLSRIEEFRTTARGFALLKHRSEGRHWSPQLLTVQTGEDSASRTFVMERFRSPGNPLILVLTNIGTVGIDLHPFCWDIAHYTPDWTPHAAEQKVGRIDRPRSPFAQKQLHIGDDVGRISIHQLIWPFTYDEKILSRLNLRAQLAERLLGSKHQAKIEAESSGDVTQVAVRFRPIDLASA